MPRDKGESHEKIIAAAMREFQERGFQQASLKAVADSVGMTSAALYRHFKSKQDMFASLVQPAVDIVNTWIGSHIEQSESALKDFQSDMLWDFDSSLSDARMILDVMYTQPDTFRLLLFRSAGTPYENTLHNIIEEATTHMMEFVLMCRERGYPAKLLSRDEMHILVTAYLMALVEPLAHGYSKDAAEQYLRTMTEFFTPGWRMITGL